MAEPAGPLAGIRVLDLTEGVAGPFATKQLADYGATVIKVERPGGDPARRMGPFPADTPGQERSGLFAFLNTNKQSIVIDPAVPDGRALILRLVTTVDAVVESFVPGTLDGWGLGYAAIAATHPKVVMTSVSPFGQHGPHATRKATDLTLAARSQWMITLGEPDQEPIKYPGNQSEYLGGLHAAWGTVVALFHAAATGEGQYVDVSVYEATAMLFDHGLVGSAYIPGHKRTRTGRRPLRFPPMVYPAADGYVSLLITDNQWPRFARMAERDDLAADKELATQDGRIARMGELEAEFIPWFLSHTKSELFERAQQFGVPLSPFYDISEVVADPHFAARRLFREVVHPVIGTMTISGPPSIMESTPWRIRTPAPLLDQDREAVLNAAGVVGARA